MQTLTAAAPTAALPFALPAFDAGATSLAVGAPDPVAAGRDAWGRIKSASKMLREDWRAVGEALLAGRRLHKSDKLFGGWCRDQGFDMDRRRRADAMWLAEEWATVQNLDTSFNSPSDIRAAHNAALAGAAEPDDTGDDTPPSPTATPAIPAPAGTGPAPVQPAPPASAGPPPREDAPADGVSIRERYSRSGRQARRRGRPPSRP